MKWLMFAVLISGCSSSRISFDNQRDLFYPQARLIRFEEIYVRDGLYYTIQVDWTQDLRTDVLYCYTILDRDSSGNPVVEQIPMQIQFWEWSPSQYLRGGETFSKEKPKLIKVEWDRDLDGKIDSVWSPPL